MRRYPNLLFHLKCAPIHLTLLYLHGFLGGQDDWLEVSELMGGQYGHLRIDLPGHNARAGFLENRYYAWEELPNLIGELLRSCNLEECTPVGYSLGGRVALYLLTRVPELFSRAVIESASPGLRTDDERAQRRLEDEKLITQLKTRPLDEFVDNWYRQPLFDTIQKTGPRFNAMRDRRLKHDPLALVRSLKYMGLGTMPSLWELLPTIRIPVLFVAGGQDAKYSALARQMASLCPKGRVAIIPGAGHNVHFERPKEFCKAVKGFLR
ncbi:MAG: 2-succinyl-6-hydroxy-2,4-cyclohexadiene-1-carboxylate synthase [Candidatus Zixiibacteriota bacterium]